jgi:hypothetical protein
MWKANIHLKDEFVTGVLRCFKDNKIPECYSFEFREPTGDYISRNRLHDKSAEEQNIHRIGKEIKDRHDLCKKEINGLCNPLWIPTNKLPSGVTEYQYLLFMRQQLWPKKAIELATFSVKTELKRSNPGNLFSKADMSNHILERSENYPFDKDWYPEWWLVFLFLGLPSGPNNVRKSFMSGKAAVINSSLENIRDLQKKGVRRGIDKLLSSPPTTPAISSGEKRKQVDLTIHYNVDSMKAVNRDNKRQRKITNLKSRISFLQLLGKDITDPNFYELVQQIIKLEEEEFAELDNEM